MYLECVASFKVLNRCSIKNTSCYHFRRPPDLWLMGCPGNTAQSLILSSRNRADKLSEQVFRDLAERASLVSKVKLHNLIGWANRCRRGHVVKKPTLLMNKIPPSLPSLELRWALWEGRPGPGQRTAFLHPSCRARRPWLCRSRGWLISIMGDLGSSGYTPLGDRSFSPNFTPYSMVFIAPPTSFPGSQLPCL